MSPGMWSQPMVCFRDVAVSRDWYTQVLGADTGHGGDEFEVSDFEAPLARVRACAADVETPAHLNPNVGQEEIWLRDPDGYRVVLAGHSPYRPRIAGGSRAGVGGHIVLAGDQLGDGQ